MGLLIMMGIFAFGVVIGVPVAFALGIGAVSAFYFEGLPLIIAFQRIISGINVFSLLAIPFFIDPSKPFIPETVVYFKIFFLPGLIN